MQHVIVVGNVIEGLNLIGPFDDRNIANEYADGMEDLGNDGYVVAALTPPDMLRTVGTRWAETGFYEFESLDRDVASMPLGESVVADACECLINNAHYVIENMRDCADSSFTRDLAVRVANQCRVFLKS